MGSNDDVAYTPIASFSGAAALWTARLQVIKFTLSTPSAPWKYIRYQVTATGGTEHALGEIEYFGSEIVTDPDFVISNITRNPVTGAITLTWASHPGESFNIKYSTDPVSFPGDVGVVLPASGGAATTTSHTFANPLPAAERLFFRIQRN